MTRSLILTGLFFMGNANAQISNYQIKDEVKTIQFFREGFLLSFPVIALDSSDKLELRFDILTSQPADLYYSIELFEYNWSPADLNSMDYIEGFNDNILEAYSVSINTTVDYVHYRLTLPNDDLKITKSGNYMLGIYRDSDKKDTVLLQRFIVFEDILSTVVSIDKFQSEILADRQELNVAINPGTFSTSELSGNIKLSVLQNNDWNTCKTFEKYNTSSTGDIVFNSPGQIVFNARNEFRFFDMKSLKHFSERVEYVNYEAPFYNAYLKPDKLRGDKDYFFREDLNGLFYIDNTDTDDEDIIDADYVYVHFVLETGYPLPADIYIDGALTNWQFSDNYMEFNPENGNYEKKLLLKQGLYNYRYVVNEYNSASYTTDVTEGDFYQAVNNYLAIVYYRALGERYYKPVGIATFTNNQ